MDTELFRPASINKKQMFFWRAWKKYKKQWRKKDSSYICFGDAFFLRMSSSSKTSKQQFGILYLPVLQGMVKCDFSKELGFASEYPGILRKSALLGKMRFWPEKARLGRICPKWIKTSALAFGMLYLPALQESAKCEGLLLWRFLQRYPGFLPETKLRVMADVAMGFW